MTKLIVLMGVMGSGKTTVSQELEKQGYQFKSNLYPDSFNYGADGHLKYVREGYMIK